MGRQKNGHDQEVFKRANQMWRADGSPPGRFREYLNRANAPEIVINNQKVADFSKPIVLHGGSSERFPVPEERKEQARVSPQTELSDMSDAASLASGAVWE